MGRKNVRIKKQEVLSMSSRLSSDKGYAKEEGREATGNRLLLFPLLLSPLP